MRACAGEAAGVQERALHHPAAAGLPAHAVQAGPAPGAPAGRAHADQARHRQRAVAVRQDAPPAGTAPALAIARHLRRESDPAGVCRTRTSASTWCATSTWSRSSAARA